MMVIRIIGPPMTIHVGNDETLKKKKRSEDCDP